jgi:hypothetical protein
LFARISIHCSAGVQGVRCGCCPRSRGLRHRSTEPALCCPMQKKRHVGPSPRERGDTRRCGSLEGANPKSAAGGQTVRWGSKGANRQEGDQTLKTERRQRGMLPDQWTFGSDQCCREKKSMRGVEVVSAISTRPNGLSLWRKAKLEDAWFRGFGLESTTVAGRPQS